MSTIAFLNLLQEAYKGYATGASDPPPPAREDRRKGSKIRPSQRGNG